jgi:hypothetical protein
MVIADRPLCLIPERSNMTHSFRERYCKVPRKAGTYSERVAAESSAAGSVARRSYAQRLQREQGSECIYLIRGNDSTGRAAWYYLQVNNVKKPRFE